MRQARVELLSGRAHVDDLQSIDVQLGSSEASKATTYNKVKVLGAVRATLWPVFRSVAAA